MRIRRAIGYHSRARELALGWGAALNLATLLAGCALSPAPIEATRVGQSLSPAPTAAIVAPSATLEPVGRTSTPDLLLLTATSPSATPQTTAGQSEDSGCFRARFVQDVTLPDGSRVEAGSILLKIWRLENAGDCAWEEPLKLVFLGGDRMSGPDGLPASLFRPGYTLSPELGDGNWLEGRLYALQPGEGVEVPIFLRAPDQPGRYQSVWGLARPGQDAPLVSFYVDIEVPEVEEPGEKAEGWEGIWDHINTRKGGYDGPLVIARAGALYQGFFYAEDGKVFLLEGRATDQGAGLEGVVGEPYEDGSPFTLRFLPGRQAFQGVFGEGEFAAEAWCGARRGVPLPRMSCQLP